MPLPSSIPAYSVGPVIGLVVNGLLTFLSLMLCFFFPRYRLLRALTLFCMSISLYFAGHAFYGFQASDESIIFWYRVMLLGLAWMPPSWIYFANSLRERRSGNLAQAAVGVALACSLVLLISDNPLILGGPLESLAKAGVRRPQSLILKPAILLFDLAVALPSVILIRYQWWSIKPRPAFVHPFLIGLIFWGLGGLHDAAYNLNLNLPLLPQPILWLASIWLSLCLTITVALHFRTLERALVRRTEALIQARNLAAMGAAASRVAHQVGGYLNKVVFGLAVLGAEPLSPQARRAVEDTERGAIRLDRFSRRLLDVARRPTVSYQPMSVADLLDTVVEARRPVAGDQGPEVVVEVDPGQMLLGDWSLLGLAFGSLVDNSLSALPPDGRLTVTALPMNGAMLQLVFQDNGPGMDQGQVEAAFAPFTADRPQDMGLGLPLVHSIIEAHNGRMSLVSSQGRGVRVELELPLGLETAPGANPTVLQKENGNGAGEDGRG